MKMKKLWSLLLVVVMMFTLIGCGAKEEAPADAPVEEATDEEAEAPADDKVTVGMVMINFVNPFYISQMDVAQKFCDEKGWELVTKSCEGSLENEVAIIENFIEQGVDFILLDAVDAEGVKDVMKKSVDAGIPIMSLNNPIEVEGNYSMAYEHYIGFKGCTVAIAEALGGEGKVCVILGGYNNYAGDERTRAFEEAIAEYPNIEVLDMQPCDWDPSKAVEITQNWLTAYEDIDAILIQTDGATASVREVVDAAGREDIIIAGNDGEVDVIKLMQEGRVTADCLLGSGRGAYLAMLMVEKVLAGETIDSVCYCPSWLIVDEELKATLEASGKDLSWIQICTPDEALEINEGYAEEFKDF